MPNARRIIFSTYAIPTQIKEMEETGMLDFEEEDDDDDFPPFLRKRKG